MARIVLTSNPDKRAVKYYGLLFGASLILFVIYFRLTETDASLPKVVAGSAYSTLICSSFLLLFFALRCRLALFAVIAALNSIFGFILLFVSYYLFAGLDVDFSKVVVATLTDYYQYLRMFFFTSVVLGLSAKFIIMRKI